MFGYGPPSEDGLPVPDGWTEDCQQQSKSWATTMAAQLARWFGGDSPN